MYQLVLFGERSAPTVEVELVVPGGIEVQDTEPTAGWTHMFLRDSSGRILKINWKGSLQLGSQVELRFVAKNVGSEGPYKFKALQRYSDGEVAEWDYAGMWIEIKAPPPAFQLPPVGYIVVGSALVTILIGSILIMRHRRG